MKSTTLLSISLAIFFGLAAASASDEPKQAIQQQALQPDIKAPELHQATIVAVGDIMFHKNQLTYAFNGKTYDFNPCFEDIKNDIEPADLALGNFETTVYPAKKYSGYPQFNAPEQTLEALKNTGFDVLVTTNNHCLDTGLDGLLSTLSYIKKYDMLPIGTSDKGNIKHAIKKINDIKIGMLAYTYGINIGMSTNKLSDYINVIDYEAISKDIKNIRKDCDYLIVYLHYGTEYIRNVEKNQDIFFKSLADLGADCVLGNHPHVARGSEVYLTKDNREVYINYSLGNFISNMDKKYTDIGLMVKLSLEKQSETTLKEVEAIPVYRYRAGKTIKVMKCDAALASDLITDSNKLYIKDVMSQLYYRNTANYKEVVSPHEN